MQRQLAQGRRRRSDYGNSTHPPKNFAVEIRPGVFRPDLSAVAKPRAREALNGRLAARVGLLDRWAVKLEAVHDWHIGLIA